MTKQQLIQARIDLFQQEMIDANNAGNWEVVSQREIQIEQLQWCLTLFEQAGKPYPFTADDQPFPHG